MLQHAPERLELKSLRWGAELHADCSSNPLTSSDSPRSRAEVQGGYFVKICWFRLFEGEYLWQICVSMMDKRELDIKINNNNDSTDKSHAHPKRRHQRSSSQPGRIRVHIEVFKRFRGSKFLRWHWESCCRTRGERDEAFVRRSVWLAAPETSGSCWLPTQRSATWKRRKPEPQGFLACEGGGHEHSSG